MLKKYLILLCVFLSGCGFHLRGFDGEYSLPYKNVYVNCAGISVCDNLSNTIKNEKLATIVTDKTKADVEIYLYDQSSEKVANGYNGIGRISNFRLTYSVSVDLIKPSNGQVIKSFPIKVVVDMPYNDGYILSMQQQEQDLWEDLHHKAANRIITHIISLGKHAK